MSTRTISDEDWTTVGFQPSPTGWRAFYGKQDGSRGQTEAVAGWLTQERSWGSGSSQRVVAAVADRSLSIGDSEDRRDARCQAASPPIPLLAVDDENGRDGYLHLLAPDDSIRMAVWEHRAARFGQWMDHKCGSHDNAQAAGGLAVVGGLSAIFMVPWTHFLPAAPAWLPSLPTWLGLG